MTDQEIARGVKPLRIEEVAEKAGIGTDHLEPYGRHKAKITPDTGAAPSGKLILVTAITPTPAGEGKTTVSIGLSDAMNLNGAPCMLALREPSLGPVFGMKGGATGGGYSQVIPMEDINLHFTGDFHAVEKANNLLSALIDNNLQSRTRSLGIDPRTVVWKRVMDMNDRSLRHIVIGLGGTANGVPRESGFNITAASEVMAILCMARNITDLKERFGNILIGFDKGREPVYAHGLKAQGAMTALMHEAVKPNLVQTLAGNPALIHGGPFANIAQGTNSIIATRQAMALAPYTVTEAGFGSDLGAEKFLDIKCRAAGIMPSAVVIVCTIRALKYHGGLALPDLQKENVEAVRKGMPNLARHIDNTRVYGIPRVVAINRFTADTAAEIEAVVAWCKDYGLEAIPANYWAEGGSGGTELARAVQQLADAPTSKPTFVYEDADSTVGKIEKVARKVYGAAGVEFGADATVALRRIEKLGLSQLPVCIAKTQYSFTDNPKALGRPEGFTLHIRDIEIAAGAGFVIPIAGALMRMPGLPEVPASEHMDVSESGEISGLF